MCYYSQQINSNTSCCRFSAAWYKRKNLHISKRSLCDIAFNLLWVFEYTKAVACGSHAGSECMVSGSELPLLFGVEEQYAGLNGIGSCWKVCHCGQLKHKPCLPCLSGWGIIWWMCSAWSGKKTLDTKIATSHILMFAKQTDGREEWAGENRNVIVVWEAL